LKLSDVDFDRKTVFIRKQKVKLPELQKLVNEQKIWEISREKPTHHRRCPTC